MLTGGSGVGGLGVGGCGSWVGVGVLGGWGVRVWGVGMGGGMGGFTSFFQVTGKYRNWRDNTINV